MSDHSSQLQSMFARYAAAWKANDGAAVADFFVEDGTLVNPFGQLADGRSAIAAIYAEYFGGMLQGSSTRITVKSVRSLGEDLAFADSEQTVVGPAGAAILNVQLSALLRREAGDWKLVDARAYSFASPP